VDWGNATQVFEVLEFVQVGEAFGVVSLFPSDELYPG
jgi:hypothetical protein